jgi:hypothetical protein
VRIALAVLMALHGVAHLVGFVGSWQLAGPESTIPYKTTVLAGKLDLGGPGIRAMGVFWLLTAVAFWLAAAAALMNQPWWTLAALGVALFSLMLSIVALPDSRIGVAVNLVILAALMVGQRAGLFTAAP